MLFLRGIRKGRWTGDPGEYSWLESGDLPADSLLDLSTKNNTLSVFYIEDEANIERIAVAMVAQKDDITNFDYALFPSESLPLLGIKIDLTLGDTADDKVNSWHRDLSELSIRKISDLAHLIASNGNLKRISEPKIKSTLVIAASSGWIKKERIGKQKMRDAIDDLLVKNRRLWHD